MKFVLVNKRILDFDEYKKEIELLRNIIVTDLKDYFDKFGFQLIYSKKSSYNKFQLTFYHQSQDLEIHIQARKKSNDKFV